MQRSLDIEKPADPFGAQEVLCLFLAAMECPHGRGVVHAEESGLDFVIGTDDEQPVLIHRFDYAWEPVQSMQPCAGFP